MAQRDARAPGGSVRTRLTAASDGRSARIARVSKTAVLVGGAIIALFGLVLVAGAQAAQPAVYPAQLLAAATSLESTTAAGGTGYQFDVLPARASSSIVSTTCT